MQQWMIYGANGYTGQLIAHEAKAQGLTPILAGRNREAIAALASELGFEHRGRLALLLYWRDRRICCGARASP